MAAGISLTQHDLFIKHLVGSCFTLIIADFNQFYVCIDFSLNITVNDGYNLMEILYQL